MITLLVFMGGIGVGVVYEKTLLLWKNKAVKAVHAAEKALKE